MRNKSFYVVLAVISFYVVSSCRKDLQNITSPSAKLAFNADTIMFDTVFTTVGSSTQNFVIYNNYSQPINISSIRLATGANSYYRLNVDGSPGKSFTNVQIGPKDSLWVFIEVTIDPNNKATPFIVTDSILFMTNGNLQWIDLVAFGQNAHFHKPAPNTGTAFFVNCNDVWTNDLPHVVYGDALVDSACTLTIQQGTSVYFHPGSALIVLSCGTLKVNGVKGSPVSFLNDRLGEAYVNVPGQWDRIWISSITHSYVTSGNTYIGSSAKNCVINYAVIKNSNIGIEADTVFDGNPNTITLQLDNSIIENAAGIAILGQGATIRCTNSIFANCGQYVAALAYGGDYSFRQCTFANYWTNSNRTTPSVYINNYFVGNTGATYVRPIRNAYFGNCIVWGNMNGEIGLDSAKIGGSYFNFVFDHSLISISDTIPTSNPAHFIPNTNIINIEDPQFTDPTNNNYIQGATSAAINAGSAAIDSILPIISLDILGNARIQGIAPDLGPYEVK